MLSRVRLFATPWNAARQASPSVTNSRSPPKPMSIKSMMLSNHRILSHPLLLLPSIFPSIRVCLNESTLLMRWPKYWSFSFNISPYNEHPGLISFRMDCLDLLAVQGFTKGPLYCFLYFSMFEIVQIKNFKKNKKWKSWNWWRQWTSKECMVSVDTTEDIVFSCVYPILLHFLGFLSDFATVGYDKEL